MPANIKPIPGQFEKPSILKFALIRMHEGVGLVDTFLARHNVRALVPDQAGDATYDELYEQLKEEHFLEKGYL